MSHLIRVMFVGLAACALVATSGLALAQEQPDEPEQMPEGQQPEEQEPPMEQEQPEKEAEKPAEEEKPTKEELTFENRESDPGYVAFRDRVLAAAGLEQPEGQQPEGQPGEQPEGQQPEGQPGEQPQGEQREGQQPEGQQPEGQQGEQPQGEQAEAEQPGQEPRGEAGPEKAAEHEKAAEREKETEQEMTEEQVIEELERAIFTYYKADGDEQRFISLVERAEGTGCERACLISVTSLVNEAMDRGVSNRGAIMMSSRSLTDITQRTQNLGVDLENRELAEFVRRNFDLRFQAWEQRRARAEAGQREAEG